VLPLQARCARRHRACALRVPSRVRFASPGVAAREDARAHCAGIASRQPERAASAEGASDDEANAHKTSAHVPYMAPIF